MAQFHSRQRKQAEDSLDVLQTEVDAALRHLNRLCTIEGKFCAPQLDDHQKISYELAFCAAELAASKVLLKYAEKVSADDGLTEQMALAFCADSLRAVWQRLLSHSLEAGLSNRKLLNLMSTEHIHRFDTDIPDEIITGAAQMGCFGTCIPERFGGLMPDERHDSIGMLVVTEELSRGSLGAAGSLITRPEIAARALLRGGTEEQKLSWLPRLAAGEDCGLFLTNFPGSALNYTVNSKVGLPFMTGSSSDGEPINAPLATMGHLGYIGEYLMPQNPLGFTGVDRQAVRPAPRLGQHTDEVLAEILGMSSGEIGRYHDTGIVAGSS